MNDAELATAIAKLRGEWQARGGGESAIDEITIEQAGGELKADLLVFPSRYLGELCEANRLRPVRASILESKELDFSDILPLVREREIVYGQQVMALPLGCPTPLLARSGNDSGPPEAPLADHYAAFVFLAKAAPLARHASREAIWFDPETMKPRLTEPPFVRALTEIVKIEKKKQSPCDVAKRLLADETKAAVVWPCRNSDGRGIAEIQVEKLPAVTRVYNPSSEEWESVPPRQVTLLATSGRLVGVSTQSRNTASAFRLAGWLASPEVAGQLIRESNGIAICRASQRRMADNWFGVNKVAGARQFSEQTFSALVQREGAPLPRLPGVDRYLELLSDAVRSAAEGNLTPPEALNKAMDEWESLTDQLGRADQRRAYRRCLGIEQFK